MPRQTERETDVLVVGGGLGRLAAALAEAARRLRAGLTVLEQHGGKAGEGGGGAWEWLAEGAASGHWFSLVGLGGQG